MGMMPAALLLMLRMPAAVLVLALLLPTLAQAACKGSPTAPRFILSAGEARDTASGLVWQRCSLGLTWTPNQGCTGERTGMSLADAKAAAKAAGGGWRLPTVDELYELVDQGCGEPPVDVTAFPDLNGTLDVEESFWTSTEAGMLNLVYQVDFATGLADARSQGYALSVRLVRPAAP